MKRRVFLEKGALAASGAIVGPLLSGGYNRIPFLARGPASPSPDMRDAQVLVLEGAPRRRGQVYGETLRSKIREFISLWKDDLKESKAMDPDAYIAEFLEKTNFLPAVERWAPVPLEELRGLGEGAGVDFRTLFAFQLADEEWAYSLKTRPRSARKESQNCSSLGVLRQGDIPAMVAQNMDLPNFFDGYQVLLKIKYPDSGLQVFAFSCAGILATCGLNNRSIGVCCNTLLQLNHSSDGLPVTFVVRKVLEQTTFAEASRFVQTVKHASGQNYIIGGPEKVIDLECSANKVAPFVPDQGATRVYHTNHPLANDDQSIYKEMLEKLTPEERKGENVNSETRFASLEKRLKNGGEKISLETVKSILTSHDSKDNPICVHNKPQGGAMTAGSMMAVLSAPPALHLALQPPCQTGYKVFKF